MLKITLEGSPAIRHLQREAVEVAQLALQLIQDMPDEAYKQCEVMLSSNQLAERARSFLKTARQAGWITDEARP